MASACETGGTRRPSPSTRHPDRAVARSPLPKLCELLNNLQPEIERAGHQSALFSYTARYISTAGSMTMKNPRWWFLRAVVVPLTRLPSQKTLVVRRMRKPKSFFSTTCSPRSLLVEELGTGVRRRGYAEPVRARVRFHGHTGLRSRLCDRSPAAPISSASPLGRGSAYGCQPTPSIKVATNSEMYRRITEDTSGYINRGDILDGVAIEEGAGDFRSDAARCFRWAHEVRETWLGDNEFVPWQVGAVMSYRCPHCVLVKPSGTPPRRK